MGTSGATRLAAFDHLASQPDLGPLGRVEDPVAFELGLGEDQQPTQVVGVEVANCIKQVAVERHGCLGDFERGEKPGDGATVGQGPTREGAEARGVMARRRRRKERRVRPGPRPTCAGRRRSTSSRPRPASDSGGSGEHGGTVGNRYGGSKWPFPLAGRGRTGRSEGRGNALPAEAVAVAVKDHHRGD